MFPSNSSSIQAPIRTPRRDAHNGKWLRPWLELAREEIAKQIAEGAISEDAAKKQIERLRNELKKARRQRAIGTARPASERAMLLDQVRRTRERLAKAMAAGKIEISPEEAQTRLDRLAEVEEALTKASAETEKPEKAERKPDTGDR